MLRTALLIVALSVASPAAADGGTLRASFRIAETSFDPAFASDAASDSVISCIIEPLLSYDYLARPVKLAPRTAEAMPVVSDGGKTYTLKLKPGVLFTPDPAFGGKPRELVAADYVYSFKRHLDPASKSPWAWMIENRIAGAADAQAAAVKAGKFDYGAKIAGLEAIDKHTLRIRLTEADYRFPYVLALPNFGAVAREVVEKYGLDVGAHPVGTGPFMLGDYKRSSRIVLVRNPGYRPESYVPTGPVPAELQPVAAAMKGKRLPQLDRIEISVIEEGQSQWLAFLNGELDLIETFPQDFVDELLVDGKLRPALAAKGIRHVINQRPNTWWIYFNMEDSVVGGYTPDKIALRRAVGMGFDNTTYLRVVLKGRALPATGIIPPGVEGHVAKPAFDAQRYDPAASRALLDRFGYKDRDGDGFRETPDGKPLKLEYWSTPTSQTRQFDELLQRNMTAIGLRIEFRKDRLPELRKMARLGKIPMRADGWNADYPDGENFMQLLYGKNVGQENQARFQLAGFDRLYEDARRLPDGPPRNALFAQMTELALTYAPWRMTFNRIEDQVLHPQVRDYAPHPILSQVWPFLRIDGAPAKR